jgi:uncharacterized RDD family membrane protein YckC
MFIPSGVFVIVSSLIWLTCTLTIFPWLYYALMESSSWQGTLGKRVMGIIVTGQGGQTISFGRATARFLARLLSEVTLGLGFLLAAFTGRKQALHDVIANTDVLWDTRRSGTISHPYAPFWRRLLAVCIDYLLIITVTSLIVVLYVTFAGQYLEDWSGPGSGILLMVLGVLVLAPLWLYNAALEASELRGTLGKWALGIMVADLKGERLGFWPATIRVIGKQTGISYCFGLPWLVMLFTSRSQAVHDLMADSLCLRRM